jgi:hypothetical protein
MVMNYGLLFSFQEDRERQKEKNPRRDICRLKAGGGRSSLICNRYHEGGVESFAIKHFPKEHSAQPHIPDGRLQTNT